MTHLVLYFESKIDLDIFGTQMYQNVHFKKEEEERRDRERYLRNY